MHHIWRRTAALPAFHRGARQFVCKRGKCRRHALRECGPACAVEECRDRSRRSNPGRSRGWRRSRTRCETISNHPERHHTHYAADDRQARRMTQLRVLAVASEIYPIVKTGGLADVVGALPVALQAHGIETRTLVPGYPDVIKGLAVAEEFLHVPEFFGGPARLLGRVHGNLN